MAQNLTRIDWTIQTGNQWWSGTDSTVKIEIYKDDTLIKRLNLEPGKTSRLNKSEYQNYFWKYVDTSGIGTSVSGTTLPDLVEFPQGVKGHLRVRLVAKGDDAWEKIAIYSLVETGKLRFIPGTIDSSKWVSEYEEFVFNKNFVLSTDKKEGVSALTLRY